MWHEKEEGVKASEAPRLAVEDFENISKDHRTLHFERDRAYRGGGRSKQGKEGKEGKGEEGRRRKRRMRGGRRRGE